MTGANADSACAITSGAMPAASAQAVAASALRALCTPSNGSVKEKRRPGACTSIRWPSAVSVTAADTAPPSMPKSSTRRVPAAARHSGAYSPPLAASRGKTATPSAGSAASTAACSAATASTLTMNSWCSRCALLISATVGWAMAASTSVSPGWFMPSSSTASRCCAVRRNSVSGRPMSLLRLPAVARRAASPTAHAKTAEIISLTVVLPLLPVTATTGIGNRRRQPAASWPSAMRVSATVSTATPDRSGIPAGGRDTSTTAAPRATTSGRKSCASKRSPISATNRSPGNTSRLSVVTRRMAASGPTRCAPAIQAAASVACIITGSASLMRSPPVPPAPGERAPDRRTAACARQFPASIRAPCRPRR